MLVYHILHFFLGGGAELVLLKINIASLTLEGSSLDPITPWKDKETI